MSAYTMKLITNGTCFEMRRITKTDVRYLNKSTGQCYRVQAIADTWQKDGSLYVDMMVLVNGAIIYQSLDQRISYQSRRATSRYLFEHTQAVYSVAMNIGERHVKKMARAS